MKRKNEIVNSINHLTCLLNTLKPKLNENEEYNQAYNRLLIERAQLRKKLSQPKIVSLFKNNLKNLNFTKKEKRICDYFSSNKI